MILPFTLQFRCQSTAISCLWFTHTNKQPKYEAYLTSCLQTKLSVRKQLACQSDRIIRSLHTFKNLSWIIHFPQTVKALKTVDCFPKLSNKDCGNPNNNNNNYNTILSASSNHKCNNRQLPDSSCWFLIHFLHFFSFKYVFIQAMLCYKSYFVIMALKNRK